MQTPSRMSPERGLFVDVGLVFQQRNLFSEFGGEAVPREGRLIGRRAPLVDVGIRPEILLLGGGTAVCCRQLAGALSVAPLGARGGGGEVVRITGGETPRVIQGALCVLHLPSCERFVIVCWVRFVARICWLSDVLSVPARLMERLAMRLLFRRIVSISLSISSFAVIAGWERVRVGSEQH